MCKMEINIYLRVFCTNIMMQSTEDIARHIVLPGLMNISYCGFLNVPLGSAAGGMLMPLKPVLGCLYRCRYLDWMDSSLIP